MCNPAINLAASCEVSTRVSALPDGSSSLDSHIPLQITHSKYHPSRQIPDSSIVRTGRHVLQPIEWLGGAVPSPYDRTLLQCHYAPICEIPHPFVCRCMASVYRESCDRRFSIWILRRDSVISRRVDATAVSAVCRDPTWPQLVSPKSLST